MSPDTRVFVVDDDRSMLRALGRLIRTAGLEVETFASPREFLSRAPHEGPGCVVLDLRLPEVDGLEVQRTMTAAGHVLPIVFLSGHGTVPASVQAMKSGAVDFLTKPVDDQRLLGAIRNGIEMSRQRHAEREEVAALRARIDSLTPREREVFELVVQGRLNKQIAGELGAAEKTIKIHRARVMRKMKAASLADLVRMAGRAGIDS